LEWVVGLSTLGSSQFREEAVTFRVRIKHGLQTLVLLDSSGFGGCAVGVLAFLLVQAKLGETVGGLISLILESKVLHQTLARVFGDQSLHHLPVCLLCFTGSA
jgi:hypothetical protein